jgi:hypothetical protein
MSPVGHTLTGIAIGAACMPEEKPRRWKAIYLGICAFLAYIPDVQLPYWGHGAHYYVSHSLFSNLGLILVCLLPFLISKPLRVKAGGGLAITGGALAWISHLLLDTFYNTGTGLMMFWPLSDARLSLAVSWFSVVTEYFSLRTLRILLVEAAFYGGILAIVVLSRVFLMLNAIHQRKQL